MTIRKIVTLNNPQLRKKSKSVNKLTSDITALIKDMRDTMYDHNGVGLAAIQIGTPKRVIVCDVSDERDQFDVYINPKIIKKNGKQIGVEGCLSVPGLEGEVERFKTIILKAKNEKFEDVCYEISDFEAVVIQHEIDHLEGVIYVDKVAPDSLKPVSANDKES
jgi:peptide deformylase